MIENILYDLSSDFLIKSCESVYEVQNILWHVMDNGRCVLRSVAKVKVFKGHEQNGGSGKGSDHGGIQSNTFGGVST